MFNYPDMVPFDNYSLSSTVLAIDMTTNLTLPMVLFEAYGRAENFVISSSGGAARVRYIYGPWSSEGRRIYITVKRTILAKAFTMCLLLVNTALAVGSAYITFLVVIRREETKDGVLLLPVTIVLTIPALRALFDGPPPFGIFIGWSWAFMS